MKIFHKHLLSLFILTLILSPLIFVNSVLAVGDTSLIENQVGFDDGRIGNVYGEASGEPTDIRLIITRIINTSLSILSILFLVLIVFGGFTWMTSGGNEDSISKAKKILSSGIIGLVIVLAAWGISKFVICKVLGNVTGYYCA